MLRFSPKHNVSLSKYHEQNAFGSVLPCRWYDGYEATTNAQLWIQLDKWHNRYVQVSEND